MMEFFILEFRDTVNISSNLLEVFTLLQLVRVKKSPSDKIFDLISKENFLKRHSVGDFGEEDMIQD